jgi:GT2 family glycosyltransferase
MTAASPRPEPVSVVIPTIGRTELLLRCLTSILATDPLPAEIVVADQSHGDEVRAAVAGLDGPATVRVVAIDGRGIAKATNDGIRAAGFPSVLVTHDDCTVATDWVGRGSQLLSEQPGAIFTGQVLPPERAEYVPSTIVSDVAHDYTDEVSAGALYPANMAVSRDELVGFGGFDERDGLRLAAEDCDLCYRWLRDGRTLRFEPSLVVWHHDWRTPEQLVRTHAVYARGTGAFYAKHLWERDRYAASLLRSSLRRGLRADVQGIIRGTPKWQDPYRGIVGPLLHGVVAESSAILRAKLADRRKRSR